MIADAKAVRQPEAKTTVVWYSTGSSFFDGWIETCPNSTLKPPTGDYYRKCVYVNGRIVESYGVAKGKETLTGRWLYNESGAPILWIAYQDDGRESRLTLGRYDERGRLSRLYQALPETNTGRFVLRIRHRFSYESVKGGEDIVTEEEFLDNRPRFVTIWQNREIWLRTNDSPLTLANYGSRKDLMEAPENYGLLPYYPAESSGDK